MQVISKNTTLVSGHPWLELRDLIEKQVQRTPPQIDSVKEVVLTQIPPVKIRHLGSSDHFKPNKARQEVMRLFEVHHPPTNPNRWRLSRVAKSLIFGAQAGRGSDNSCVINRTHESKYARLIEVVHQLGHSDLRSDILAVKFLSLREPEPA